MKLTFISGHKPLCKTVLEDGSVLPYPLIKTITSYDVDVNSVEEAHNEIVRHANIGCALMRGSFQRPLVSESRRGLSNKDAPTQRITLDFDRIKLPKLSLNKTKFDRVDVSHVANACIRMLPKCFHDVSYSAKASTSFFKNDTYSIHLEMFLATPMDVAELKMVLKGLNFASDFKDQIRLNSGMRSLSWPIDVCLGDNSRIVFITPPHFENEVHNPFVSNNERFYYREGLQATLDVAELIEQSESSMAAKRQQSMVKKLQKQYDIVLPKEKSKTLKTADGDVRVVVNPPSLQMEFYADHGSYVTYNVGSGDSHAYFVQKNSPTIVRNWKGEPFFSFCEANPEMYDWHIEQFGGRADNSDDEEASNAMPVVFRDIISDTHYVAQYNRAEDSFEYLAKIARNNVDDFFTDFGSIAPTVVPQMHKVFNPQIDFVLDYKRRLVNSWKTPPLMKVERKNLVDYDQSAAWLHQNCPTIFKIIDSITVSNEEDQLRFLNWLAFIYQFREKTKTSWLFQGVQGTGKGVLFSRILKPIFAQYAVEKTMGNLDEMFNGWIAESLLVAIDEFGYSFRNRQLHQKLKSYITEDEMTLRAMRTEQQQVESYSNFICFTNEFDPMPLEETDRRMNICQRQERPIVTVHKSIMHEIEHLLPDEVPVFAQLLSNIKVNRGLARTTVNSEAKQKMLQQAQSVVDQLCNGLKYGKWESFEDILSRDLIVAQTEESMTFLAAKNVILVWLKRIANNSDGMVQAKLDEIKIVYSYMTGERNQTDARLIKIFGYRGVDIKKYGKGRIGWIGTLVHWDLSRTDAKSLLEEVEAVNNANVPSIARNP